MRKPPKRTPPTTGVCPILKAAESYHPVRPGKRSSNLRVTAVSTANGCLTLGQLEKVNPVTCGWSGTTRYHSPTSRTTRWKNFAAACHLCNQKKAAFLFATIEEIRVYVETEDISDD